MPDADIKSLAADVAIGAVITGLIFAVAATVPLIGIAAAILVPMPVMHYRAKHGRSIALAIASITVFGLWTILAIPAGDMLFLLGLLTIGIALGEWIDRSFSVERLVGTVCIAVAGVVLLAMMVAGAVTGQGVIDMVTGYVNKSLDLWLQWYTRSGAGAADLEKIRNALEQLGRALTYMMPAMILSTTLVITWINLLLARTVYRWRQQPFPDFGPLIQWSAPEPMVWAAISSGLLVLLPLGTPLTVIGGNAALVVVTIYFFHGIAIVHFFMEKKKIPRALRVLTYSLVVFQTLLALLIAGLGLFDLWLDLRKLKTNGSG